ncbi:hypothetical protein NT01EI_1411 [Edwardsiella ictaluri 93-146]|uniref:Uncharacterized protein n=1 Tax=Edwardsiella ictaluri (strain 93-146) TaxID=634503 RepID=C5BDQ2_EDWI9|nr:hypothetical protein NT01EI_1411 [Edwardsiella ictaluri 93-146]
MTDVPIKPPCPSSQITRTIQVTPADPQRFQHGCGMLSSRIVIMVYNGSQK